MSAVSAKQVGDAIKRLREVIPMSDRTPAGLLEEVTVRLRRNVDDPAHLKRVVDRLIDTCKWFPTVAELQEAIDATPAAEEKRAAYVAMGCERCDWTGYIQTRDQAGHEAVTECRCLREGRMEPRPEDWWKRDAAADGDFLQAKRGVEALARADNL